MSENIQAVIENGLKNLETKMAQTIEKHEGQIRESGEASKKLIGEIKAQAEQHDAMIKELKKQTQSAADSLVSLQQKGVKIDNGNKSASMGAQFVESEQFKAFKSGNSLKASMEFKNTILGEDGSPKEPSNVLAPRDKMPGIIAGAFRPLRILDAIPTGVTNSNNVLFARELLFTNNAAETSEGGSKPASVLTFEEGSAPVRTIAHTIKVSKQILDDAPLLQSYIDRRMAYGVNVRLESQIIAGNGTTPNISGILDSGNYTAATVVTADNAFDFANRIKYQVIASDYTPDFFMINPADWGVIERLKVGTGDDRYVGAGGAVSYVNNGLVPVLWGLPVIVSSSVTAGKLICMASDACMFFNRQSTTVEIFNQNEDDVNRNLLTIRAEARGAFAVFRPSAIVAGTIPT